MRHREVITEKSSTVASEPWVWLLSLACVLLSFPPAGCASPHRAEDIFQRSSPVCQRMVPTHGVIRAAVILTKTPTSQDEPFTTTQVDQMAFGDHPPAFFDQDKGTLRNFVEAVSYGALSITGDVFGWWPINFNE